MSDPFKPMGEGRGLRANIARVIVDEPARRARPLCLVEETWKRPQLRDPVLTHAQRTGEAKAPFS